jgi:beta-glucanase (GH16 family)
MRSSVLRSQLTVATLLFPIGVLGCASDSSPGSAMTHEQGAGDAALADVSTGVSSDATPSNATGDGTASSALGDGPAGTANDATAPTTVDDSAVGDSSGQAGLPGWTLTWADEFNGSDGSPVDPSKWSHDVGGNGWGNAEREYYTDGAQNAVQQGGNLVITATTAGASQYKCSYGTCQYTSARLLTKMKFAQQYGRIESRIQIPFGQGLWPAFWMLGSNISTVPWPACGEIDIMENIGKEPTMVHGSLHMTGANFSGTFTLPNGGKFSDAFHTYAVEWDASAIRFYVDDQLYETRTPANVPNGGKWAFDQPFFILLNVAVGGQWPGNPDTTTTFPQTMKVDWVRVYQRAAGGG